jgi:hypothetical protein
VLRGNTCYYGNTCGLSEFKLLCCAVNIRANKYVKAGYSDDSHFITCCIIYPDRRIINEGMLHVHLSSLSEQTLKFTEMKTGLDRNYCLSFTERDVRMLK